MDVHFHQSRSKMLHEMEAEWVSDMYGTPGK